VEGDVILLAPKAPPVHSLLDVRCADARDIAWPEADLVLTDGPWTYTQRFGESAAGDHYDTLPTPVVVEILDRLRAPRLALWMTGPILGEWVEASRGWSWGPIVSVGCWGKTTGHGQGYHWAGDSELVLMYSRGGGHLDRSVALSNLHLSPRSLHSRKPAAWQAGMVRQWVPEGGLVLDPFCGLGSTPEAVLRAGGGRRCLATEISPKRYSEALSLLAQVRAT
jgi:hypothetical protein